MRLKSLIFRQAQYLVAILVVLGISVALISPVAAMGKAPQKAQAQVSNYEIWATDFPAEVGKLEGPAIATNADGKVLVWTEPNRFIMNAEKTDENGIKVFKIQVYSAIAKINYVLSNNAVLLPGGGFVVTATIAGGLDGDGMGVFYWVFDDQGRQVGSRKGVPHTVRDQKDPFLAVYPDGSILLTYIDCRIDLGDVLGLHIDANGNPLGPVFPIANGEGRQLDAKALIEGQTIYVVYDALTPDTDWFEVYLARLNLDGTPAGPTVRVNNYVRYNQLHPGIALTYSLGPSPTPDGFRIVFEGSTPQDTPGIWRKAIHKVDFYLSGARKDINDVQMSAEKVGQMYPVISSSGLNIVHAWQAQSGTSKIRVQEKGILGPEIIQADAKVYGVGADAHGNFDLALLRHDPVTYMMQVLKRQFVRMNPVVEVGEIKMAVAKMELTKEKVKIRCENVQVPDEVKLHEEAAPPPEDPLPSTVRQIGKIIRKECPNLLADKKIISKEFSDAEKALTVEEQKKLEVWQQVYGASWVKTPTKLNIYEMFLVYEVPAERKLEGRYAVVLPKDLAAAIQDLIDLVKFINLPQGIENSLDAKLENAARALLRATDGYGPEAANMLEAFVYECEAQKGKKLTVAQADELIAVAQPIIDDLRQ